MVKQNKVVTVSLTGGIIGAFGSSPNKRLNEEIRTANAQGWRVVQIIPAASGNLFLYLWRLILLCVTLLFYTTANGYYVVLEKVSDECDSNSSTTERKQN